MTPLSIVSLVLVAALAWFVSVDPLKYSMGRGIAEFNPHYIEAPPAEKFKDFPRDTQSKLQNGEIMWQGQMLGPESLAFDSQGRGPYTGVSDGRILRYDGPELGWSTFAYTSRNRFAFGTSEFRRKTCRNMSFVFGVEVVTRLELVKMRMVV